MRDGYQLSDSAPGHYMPLREDKPLAKAYFPDNLPPTIELTDEIVDELAAAMHALGRLDGLGSEVDNPGTVFSSFVYKEAEQSSQVEGTKVTVADIYRYELEVMEGEVTNESTNIQDVREARNYILALEDAIKYIQRAGRSRESVTLELIKSLHETVLERGRTDEDDPLPGEFRPGLVSIEETTHDGLYRQIRFVPPPADSISRRMTNLESYIQSNGHYPDLIDIGLIHYQFETIHPFKDGNGRVGRLLIVLLLICCNILVNPLVYPSSYIRRHRDQYADLLLNVSEHGAWEEWLLFFLECLKNQAEEAFVRAKLLLQKRNEYETRYEDAPNSVSTLAVELFEEPYFTVSEAAEMIGMSYQSANSAIDQLLDDEVVAEITGKQTDRVFRAEEIMDLVERPAETLPNANDLIASDVTNHDPITHRR